MIKNFRFIFLFIKQIKDERTSKGAAKVDNLINIENKEKNNVNKKYFFIRN